MDRFDDDTLCAELRALRSTPRPEFAAELDRHAAAGFPRSVSPAAATPFAVLAGRWRALSPRRRLVPVLAMALAMLAVATAVVAISQSGRSTRLAANSPLGLAGSGGAGGARTESAAGAGAGGASKSAGPESGMEAASAGRSAQRLKPFAKKSTHGVNLEYHGAYDGSGPYLTKDLDAAFNGRDIERSASVVLGAKPGKVSGAAAKVYEAVHAANGVVLHSRVRSGSAGATGAYFELLIPSGRLSEALAAFSAIAAVRERHDATDDITAPTVRAGEELRDSNAAIDGLLKELGDVETEAEREPVEARLRDERRRHAAIRTRLDHLDKRAAMSAVTVRIVTGRGAGVTPASRGSGNWGVGDALHDAGQILMLAAGVVLIALAVLAPIGLIALVLWLANRFLVRRLRERTLG